MTRIKVANRSAQWMPFSSGNSSPSALAAPPPGHGKVNAAAEHGTVLATSCFLDPTPTAFSTHFALSCALHAGGRGYTIDEMREMFRGAALRNIRVLNLGKHWRALLGEVS